jgi:hypothetical protein
MQVALLWTASALAALTWAVHTFIGGIHIARPLLADTGLPKAAKWLAYYCWHLVTLMLLGMACLFALGAAGRASTAVMAGLAGFSLACSLLSVAVALKGGLRPWRLPSTLLFALTGAAGLAGALL